MISSRSAVDLKPYSEITKKTLGSKSTAGGSIK
jgi:hypothetical protein